LGKVDGFRVGADSDETDWLDMEGCAVSEKEDPPPKPKAHKPK